MDDEDIPPVEIVAERHRQYVEVSLTLNLGLMSAILGMTIGMFLALAMS